MAEILDPNGPIAPHPVIQAVGLEGQTPLWFYVLAEAEEHDGKLGPVGGTLVAGTLLNILRREGSSIANNPNRDDALTSVGIGPTFNDIRSQFGQITAQ